MSEVTVRENGKFTKSFDIFSKLPSGVLTSYAVDWNTTIKEVKCMMEFSCGIPADLLQLAYKHHFALCDNDTLRNLCITPGVQLPVKYTQGYENLLESALAGDTHKLFSNIYKHSDRTILEKKKRGVALYVAAQRGYHYLVERLLKEGADPNYQTPYGRTPLHVACGSGNGGCIDSLLEHGASMDIKDDFKQTPAEVAHNHGQQESERRLLLFRRVVKGPTINQRKIDDPKRPAYSTWACTPRFRARSALPSKSLLVRQRVMTATPSPELMVRQFKAKTEISDDSSSSLSKSSRQSNHSNHFIQPQPSQPLTNGQNGAILHGEHEAESDERVSNSSSVSNSTSTTLRSDENLSDNSLLVIRQMSLEHTKKRPMSPVEWANRKEKEEEKQQEKVKKERAILSNRTVVAEESFKKSFQTQKRRQDCNSRVSFVSESTISMESGITTSTSNSGLNHLRTNSALTYFEWKEEKEKLKQRELYLKIDPNLQFAPKHPDPSRKKATREENREAFENWLNSKQEQLKQEKLARRWHQFQQFELEREKKEHKMKSAKSYDHWLAQKELQRKQQSAEAKQQMVERIASAGKKGASDFLEVQKRFAGTPVSFEAWVSTDNHQAPDNEVDQLNNNNNGKDVAIKHFFEKSNLQPEYKELMKLTQRAPPPPRYPKPKTGRPKTAGRYRNY